MPVAARGTVLSQEFYGNFMDMKGIRHGIYRQIDTAGKKEIQERKYF